MTQWPTGWREHALRHAGIPITDFAMEVLHLWEQATPTDRFTNNPLGMPARQYGVPRALNTEYAAFPTMQRFYDAFSKAATGGRGSPLLTAIAVHGKHSSVWREIHALGWPANKTETDYPSTVLDRVPGALPKEASGTAPTDRKTVGKSIGGTAGKHPTLRHNELLYQATSRMNDSKRAMEYLAKRINRNG